MTCCVTCGIVAGVVLGIVCYVKIAFRGGSPGGRFPRGGGSFKNFVAYLMTKYGNAPERADPATEARMLPKVPTERWNDSFYFLGVTNPSAAPKATEITFLTTRLAFREELTEVWFGVQTRTHGLLRCPIEVAPASEKAEEVASGGVRFTCVERTKEWKVEYAGPLVDGTGANHDALVQLTFRGTAVFWPYQQDPWTMAQAIAEQPWSGDYFKQMQKEKASRIEQGGRLVGTIRIDGTEYQVDMNGLRDHSWGRRDWNFITHHVWYAMCVDENKPLVISGKKYTHFVFTLVEYGTVFKNLVTGWAAGEDCVLPIVEGPDMSKIVSREGTVPETHTVEFRARGSQVFRMTVHRQNPMSFLWKVGFPTKTYMVSEAAARVEIEGHTTGYGMAEFGYHL